MRIRAATADDAAAINEIYNPYVLASTCTLQLMPSTLEERRAWLASLEPATHPALMAEADGVCLGWGSLVPFHVRPGYRHSVLRLMLEDTPAALD